MTMAMTLCDNYISRVVVLQMGAAYLNFPKFLRRKPWVKRRLIEEGAVELVINMLLAEAKSETPNKRRKQTFVAKELMVLAELLREDNSDVDVDANPNANANANANANTKAGEGGSADGKDVGKDTAPATEHTNTNTNAVVVKDRLRLHLCTLPDFGDRFIALCFKMLDLHLRTDIRLGLDIEEGEGDATDSNNNHSVSNAFVDRALDELGADEPRCVCVCVCVCVSRFIQKYHGLREFYC